MDFWGTVVVLFRRWYVTLTAFALAVGATLAVYASIPTVYVSTAVLVLTIPTTGGSVQQTVPSRSYGASPPSRLGALAGATPGASPETTSGGVLLDPSVVPQPTITPGRRLGDRTNPLLNFDKGLNVAATIVVTSLETPETAARLGIAPGGDPTFKVNNGNDNPESLTQSPFVFVEGRSTSPEQARSIVAQVVAEARKVLAEQQRKLNAPIATYIKMDESVSPTTPQPETNRKSRAAAVVLAMGGAAGVSAAFAAESIATARRRRKEVAAAMAASGAQNGAERHPADDEEQPGNSRMEAAEKDPEDRDGGAPAGSEPVGRTS